MFRRLFAAKPAGRFVAAATGVLVPAGRNDCCTWSDYDRYRQLSGRIDLTPQQRVELLDLALRCGWPRPDACLNRLFCTYDFRS